MRILYCPVCGAVIAPESPENGTGAVFCRRCQVVVSSAAVAGKKTDPLRLEIAVNWMCRRDDTVSMREVAAHVSMPPSGYLLSNLLECELSTSLCELWNGRPQWRFYPKRRARPVSMVGDLDGSALVKGVTTP